MKYKKGTNQYVILKSKLDNQEQVIQRLQDELRIVKLERDVWKNAPNNNHQVSATIALEKMTDAMTQMTTTAFQIMQRVLQTERR